MPPEPEQVVEHEGTDAPPDLFAVPIALAHIVGHGGRDQVDHRTIQRRGDFVLAEQTHDVGAEAGVGDVFDEGDALDALAVQRAVEQLAHGAPALSIHGLGDRLGASPGC
ncbi:MAG: hypothetical protein IPO95_09610 [Rhodanobacteraceae bacterium]|nr:hypothetical protein [Rhodanobacteraceae bacterium]